MIGLVAGGSCHTYTHTLTQREREREKDDLQLLLVKRRKRQKGRKIRKVCRKKNEKKITEKRGEGKDKGREHPLFQRWLPK